MSNTTGGRTPKQIREHYEIEKALADRLRRAPKAERVKLYGEVYDELFRRIPHHPQLLRKKNEKEKQASLVVQLSYIRPFLEAHVRFLEIGAGDCGLAAAGAPFIKSSCALEVAREIAQGSGRPPNMKTRLFDGVNIPLPDNSIHVAYSNQLVEHLHPEDALDHLKSVFRVMAPGGRYVCITPNRLYGPHDISRHFDKTATGLHLKEYTVGELNAIMKQAGFSCRRIIFNLNDSFKLLPASWAAFLETCIKGTPGLIRKRILVRPPVQCLLGIKYVAVK